MRAWCLRFCRTGGRGGNVNVDLGGCTGGGGVDGGEPGSPEEHAVDPHEACEDRVLHGGCGDGVDLQRELGIFRRFRSAGAAGSVGVLSDGHAEG